MSVSTDLELLYFLFFLLELLYRRIVLNSVGNVGQITNGITKQCHLLNLFEHLTCVTRSPPILLHLGKDNIRACVFQFRQDTNLHK